MKCLVCGKEYDQNSMGKCPVCSFQGVTTIGAMDDKQRRDFEDMARKYREHFLSNVKLSIVAYEWEANEEEILVLANKDYVEFPPCKNMEFGKNYAIGEQFARVDGPTAELILSIDNNGNKKEIPVTMNVPQEAEFWTVSVSLEDGFTVKLHLNSKNEATESQAISIF